MSGARAAADILLGTTPPWPRLHLLRQLERLPLSWSFLPVMERYMEAQARCQGAETSQVEHVSSDRTCSALLIVASSGAAFPRSCSIEQLLARGQRDKDRVCTAKPASRVALERLCGSYNRLTVDEMSCKGYVFPLWPHTSPPAPYAATTGNGRSSWARTFCNSSLCAINTVRRRDNA